MTETRTLHVEIDGRTLPVDIRKQTSERSAHTGRELIELHGRASAVTVEDHAWVSQALTSVADRAVRAVDEVGEFAGRWCVSWNSYGESGGVHIYTLLLREAEELSLDALVLDGLELHPYEYREEFAGESLTILAKVVGSEADVAELRSLLRSRATFPVTRRGIQDEPREMRLGVGEWSVAEDRVKYRLILVDPGLETSSPAKLALIDEERNRAALGFYASFLDRLADVMVEKGVLSREELANLRDGARTSSTVAGDELWYVADVDTL